MTSTKLFEAWYVLKVPLNHNQPSDQCKWNEVQFQHWRSLRYARTKCITFAKCCSQQG